MSINIVFNQPGKVLFYKNSLNDLGTIAKSFGKKTLVVTGKTFAKKYGYIERIRNILESNGLHVTFFSEVEPNPSIRTVERGIKVAKKEKVDLYIAFGGGSAIDAMKAINVVDSLGGKVTDYFYPNVVEDKVKPMIAIPTTHGTGSEVTKYSILTDTENVRKIAISGPGIVPDIALLDPLVLKHLPSSISASTGLDALSHAIEAYFSKKSDAMSDIFALESVNIIFNYLPCAVKGDMKCREHMFFASLLAGIAINHAGTNIAHGLSYYLTVSKNVPHGFACALILSEAVEILSEALPEKTERMAKKLGLEVEYSKTLKRNIKNLLKEVGAPTNLEEIGFHREDIGILIEEALGYRRNLENSPLKVGEEIIKTIYENLFT